MTGASVVISVHQLYTRQKLLGSSPLTPARLRLSSMKPTIRSPSSTPPSLPFPLFAEGTIPFLAAFEDCKEGGRGAAEV